MLSQKSWGLKIGLILSAIIITALVWNKSLNPSADDPTSIPSTNLTDTSPNSIQSPPDLGIFYPIAGYRSRITNRDHGKETTLELSRGFACGGQFEGIHIGDDLEVTAEELNQEIPVFAIAKAVVRQIKAIGGYGGLLITEQTVNNQVTTAYYGHISLKKAKVKTGDTVTAGQPLTYLAENCSVESSNERKHLHFAIHKGTWIDGRGYVTTREALDQWLDPQELLQQLGAAEPKLN